MQLNSKLQTRFYKFMDNFESNRCIVSSLILNVYDLDFYR